MTRPSPPPAASRVDRRKARTREALVEAAIALIGEGRGDRASIQEITEKADVGFGSFYNHFESKEQLFLTASEELLERWGQMIDLACEGAEDPAEVFALSFRISGRLGWTHPTIAQFLVGGGLQVLRSKVGLAPRALRDIKAGQASGRFAVPSPDVALTATAGALLGLLQEHLVRPRGLRMDAVDETAAAVLRFLGVSPAEAAELVARPLPDLATRTSS